MEFIENFKKIGDPLSIKEFLDHYSMMIRYVLDQLTFADLEDSKTHDLYEMEMIRAETTWSHFVEINGRPPDYEFLQKEVTLFGVERLSLFEGSSKRLSVDNFVHTHIQQLKIENILSGRSFEPRDLAYVESYERNKAYEYFCKRDRYIYGYEDYRISINETMQRAGYKQLRSDFLNDPQIICYRKDERNDVLLEEGRFEGVYSKKGNRIGSN